MRFYEIQAVKPLTPQQARLNLLKQQKNKASAALKHERQRQRQAAANERIRQAQQSMAKLKNKL